MNIATVESNDYQQQLKDQIANKRCTAAVLISGTWIWCQRPHHQRGRKRKCVACLSASSELKDRLVAQEYCACKQDHPAGSGCPDRHLRDFSFHRMTEEHVVWVWLNLLTNGGKIQLGTPTALTRLELKHIHIFLDRWRKMSTMTPKRMDRFLAFVADSNQRRRLSRFDRNWLILRAATYYRRWEEWGLDPQRKLNEYRQKQTLGKRANL